MTGAAVIDPVAAAEAVIAALSPGALWKFNEGAGTQLTDYSGNAKHGTLGATTAAPTWTAEGLSFDGGDHVALPSLAAVYGIDIVFKPNSAINAASGNIRLLGNISVSGVAMGAVTGSLTNEIVNVHQEVADGYGTANRRGWTHASEEISAAWHLLQLDVRPATQYWNIAFDGVAKDNASANTPTEFLTGVWRIASTVSGINFFTGSIAYLIFYGAARTDPQQAACRAALTAIMAARSVTLP